METKQLSVITMEYDIVVEKRIRLKSFRTHREDINDAEIDVRDAMKFFRLNNKCREGRNHFSFKAKYVGREDGFYDPPLFFELERKEIRQYPEYKEKVDKEKSIWLIIWERIKRKFQKKKRVKRGNNKG